MVDPSIERELLQLLSSMPVAMQHALLAQARSLAAQPTPEQREAAWQEFLSRKRDVTIDDEFEIGVEECGYMPVPFWHPHELIY